MKKFYGRCSTGRQKMSEELQLNEVETKYGCMDEIYFDTDVSGDAELSKRKALIELLASLKKNDEIYIYSFSRMARSTFLMLFIEKEIDVKGAKLISVKEEEASGKTAEAKLMRVLLSAVAEYEKELIKARVASSRKVMRKNGRYLGGRRPFGYKVNGKELAPVESEQSVIRRMISWKNSGMTTQAITDTLNANGILSATGNTWCKTAAFKVMKNASHSTC